MTTADFTSAAIVVATFAVVAIAIAIAAVDAVAVAFSATLLPQSQLLLILLSLL